MGPLPGNWLAACMTDLTPDHQVSLSWLVIVFCLIMLPNNADLFIMFFQSIRHNLILSRKNVQSGEQLKTKKNSFDHTHYSHCEPIVHGYSTLPQWTISSVLTYSRASVAPTLMACLPRLRRTCSYRVCRKNLIAADLEYPKVPKYWDT